jgi:hypothetical protein
MRFSPATMILVGAALICAVWLLGIYVGAMWERESMALVRADRLCVCKP